MFIFLVNQGGGCRGIFYHEQIKTGCDRKGPAETTTLTKTNRYFKSICFCESSYAKLRLFFQVLLYSA